MAGKINPIRETDAAAIKLARWLIGQARFGALAVVDPETGGPFVSRVGTATDGNGSPVILISSLSRHTQALVKDPRCSLLVGEPGKGDPLAHPRITLVCAAEKIERNSAELAEMSNRYLQTQPKAQLYVSFADFSFYRLRIQTGFLNGGFGQAYVLGPADLANLSDV